jgi:hypothetical protein
MTATRDDLAHGAGQLIAFGLRGRLRPAQDPEYAALLQRYRADSALREMVAVVASGLGLVVLGETDHGLVLGAEQGSPFAVRLEDYKRSRLSVDERLCHGLIQLAIAAWCFPTAESLEDPDAVAGATVSTRRIVEYLVDLCGELKERHKEDPDIGTQELREAWRIVLARAETRGTADGRRSASTLSGMVAHALEFLEAGGLLRRVGDQDGGSWQALGSYRLQVRELAAHALARLVRQAGQAVEKRASDGHATSDGHASDGHASDGPGDER